MEPKMTDNPVLTGVLLTGAALGATVIGSVTLMYLRHHKVGQGGALMMVAGIILLGLSVWQSFEMTVGQITLKAQSALNQVQEAQEFISGTVPLPPSGSTKCEEERARLAAALQVQLQKEKQLQEMLSNIEMALHDMTMTPIRDLR
jgi:hypothetical protein